MRLSILMMALFSLAGCQSYVATSGCPPLVTYSAADQKQASSELRALLPRDSQIARMIVDYGKMRDACRAGGVK